LRIYLNKQFNQWAFLFTFSFSIHPLFIDIGDFVFIFPQTKSLTLNYVKGNGNIVRQENWERISYYSFGHKQHHVSYWFILKFVLNPITKYLFLMWIRVRNFNHWSLYVVIVQSSKWIRCHFYQFLNCVSFIKFRFLR